MLALTLSVGGGKSSKLVWLVEDQSKKRVLVLMRQQLADGETQKTRVASEACGAMLVMRDGHESDPWPLYVARRISEGWTIVDDLTQANSALVSIFGEPTPPPGSNDEAEAA